MASYILRRILATMPVMAIVALFVFGLLYIAPGDPAAVIAGDQASPADVERIRQSLGLDRPFLVQFGTWLWRILHGDLGTSIFTNLPVASLIAQRIEPTLSLMAITLVLTILVAVPLGVVAAWKAGSWVDRTIMAFAVFGFSLLASRLCCRIHPRLCVRAAVRMASRAGLHAAGRRLLAMAGEPDPPGRRARLRLHRADRAHYPCRYARGTAAGLYPPRPRQGPGAAPHPVRSCAEKRSRSDRDGARYRHCPANRRRGGDRKCVRHPGSWPTDDRRDPAPRLPGHPGHRPAVQLPLCAG